MKLYHSPLFPGVTFTARNEAANCERVSILARKGTENVWVNYDVNFFADPERPGNFAPLIRVDRTSAGRLENLSELFEGSAWSSIAAVVFQIAGDYVQWMMVGEGLPTPVIAPGASPSE